MKIACIGWGSLIWRPENLLIRRHWFSDGPLLPIEFTRQSRNGRLTLVITESVKPIRTLWALMETDDLLEAKKSLQIRERTSENYIASITATEDTMDNNKQIIRDWIISLKIDAAIWTNLPPKYNGIDGQIPTIDQAVFYLHSITDINTRTTAEQYIRKTPKQIDTDYRRIIEKEFGWKPID